MSGAAMTMTRINLLDWRAAKREQRQKQFFAMLGGGALAAAAVCFIVIGWFNAQLNAQEERNARLKQEIALVEEKIQEIKDLEKIREDLISRTQVIEKLQQSRAEMVHFFDEIATTKPEGVYLTRIEQTGAETRIDGVAESNGRVSTYIRNLESAQWLHDPRLVFIRANEDGRRRLSEFSLRVRVGQKKNPDEEVFEG